MKNQATATTGTMQRGHTIPILGLGHVRYVDHIGSDTRIVEAARQSYSSPSKGYEADMKLLKYLYVNQHTSPFEQCAITFEIKMPIFIMRQFVRHRTFKINELSGRYTELPYEFYIPSLWRVQDLVNKQGSVEKQDPVWNLENTEIVKQAFENAYTAYEELLKRGVCREQARIVLPVALFTQIYVTADLRNLLHFLNLRTDGHAQKEIQELANAVETIASELFPATLRLRKQYKLRMVEQ